MPAGGYSIKAVGGTAESPGSLEITAPDGKKTLIWGDPHVAVDKDGNGPGGYAAAFDYKGNLNITLPDGTKIETETAKLDNGTTVLKTVGVIDDRGNVGVRFSHMNEGRENLQVNVGNGNRLDGQIDDGTSLFWNVDGDYTADNGFGGIDQEVTQSFIDQQEAGGSGATSPGRGHNRPTLNHGGGNGTWQGRFDPFLG